MPRDLPVGNGSLLVNFDDRYRLRDVYYPHVGQENQTGGDPNRFGVWVDGAFSWLDGDDWQRDLRYEEDTLVTRVTCLNERLGLSLVCTDAVDIGRSLYIKRVALRDLSAKDREVRLFQHLDPNLWGNSVGDTVFFDPDHRALVAYKGRRYLWLGARAGKRDGLTHWATGRKGGGMEGTWRDAEDGQLGGSPIAQGSVDCVGGVDVSVAANGSAVVSFWLAAGVRYADVLTLHELAKRRGPESFVERTRAYWRLWVAEDPPDRTHALPEAVSRLYRRSLLVLRTQIDNGGAIIAACDADILQFGRDTYAYLWPRDGALVAHALIGAGHERTPRAFFSFCDNVLMDDGYLLHKYNPDGSAGSSWHPWLARDGSKQLPIQEDETALVLWALGAHFRRFRDVEFTGSVYRKLVITAADFLCEFRESQTGLPLPSYDLWEERHGVSTYTTAAVVGGLEAAAYLVEAYGETERATQYRTVAETMRQAARRHLYDPERGAFSRMVHVGDGDAVDRDPVLDASVAGVFQFGLFPADDPMVVSTMQAIERRLWCKTAVGGIARYEDDYYHQISQDLEQVPGNPWFICTLWLADWSIARATTLADLARAREILEWVADHALPSGVLAEQVHPYTGDPLSVSPLTWSHAAFVETVNGYLARHQALAAEASDGRVAEPVDAVDDPVVAGTLPGPGVH